MKKRILSTLLVLCITLSLLPIQALATNSPSSGTCGDNLVWTLDAEGTLTISGTGSMYDYNSLDNPSPWDDMLSSINVIRISSGITSIGKDAFSGCFNLISAIIPETVTSIGSSAFNYCRSLALVSIPETVTSIGSAAFRDCKALASVNLPPSLTCIESQVFLWCEGLTSITIPYGITNIKGGAFEGCHGLTDITIPSSVSEIGSYAFSNCSNLSHVVFSGSDISLFYPFAGCDKLKTAGPIGSGCNFEFGWTDRIPDRSFGSSDLVSIIIPDNITLIDNYAFAGCKDLTNVTIPDSVTNIGVGAFNNCDSLTDVYYSGSKAQWDAITVDSNNAPLTRATIHYNSSGGGSGSEPSITITLDPGETLELPIGRLDPVHNPETARQAVDELVNQMTDEQKSAPTGIDLATLYAETAVAKASSMDVTGSEIIVNAESVSEVGTVAAQAAERVEDALTNGGINMARYLSKTVTLRTDETDISILVSPDVLSSSVDKVRVETPSYALVFKLSDLAPDLTQSLTFTARLSGEVSAASGTGIVQSLSASNAEYQTIVKSILANAAAIAVEVGMGNGRTSNSVTICLPVNDGDKTYQTVASTDGTATASKYNPATGVMEGKINASGTYTVKTNQKDFSDIANKSAEMQKAIRYLASKGIISGTTATTFSPDGSINRAEIATLLVKTLGKLDSTATASFSDVTKGNWFYTAAASSQRHKLINGYEDNTFRGTTNISKVQIVAVSSRVLKTEMGYKEPASPAAYLSKYSDTIDSWAQSEVALATKENLVVYRTDGTFSGNKNMTRGDAAIIVYRLFQRIW